jgi:ArsR family transcriptional regulator
MRSAGLLTSHRQGKHVFYSASDSSVLRAVAAIQQVAERRSAEVRGVIAGYFEKLDELEPVSRKELTRRLKDGLVTVLDVRPGDEYAAGHLPQAINIPLRDLPRRLREIPKGHEVVAYCRGSYCVLAFEAVALLRARGFKVRRLEDGYPEWRASGLPVARGASASRLAGGSVVGERIGRGVAALRERLSNYVHGPEAVLARGA